MKRVACLVGAGLFWAAGCTDGGSGGSSSSGGGDDTSSRGAASSGQDPSSSASTGVSASSASLRASSVGGASSAGQPSSAAGSGASSAQGSSLPELSSSALGSSSVVLVSSGSPSSSGVSSSSGITSSSGAPSSAGPPSSGLGASSSGAQPQALIFSEYTEPSTGNTKGIEIYNGTGGTADLGAYVLRVLVNGGSSQNDLTLAGALGAGGTHVVCNSNSAAALLGRCNTPWGSLTFNGDDTLVLLLNGVQVDAFGDGTDPGTAWGTTVKSMNGTLQRKCSVTRGMAALTPPFDPATEWDLVPDEALTGFGSWHCGGPGGSSSSAASSGTSAVISSSQATASSAAGSSSASSFSSPSSSSVGTSNSSAGGSSVVLLGITVAPPQAFETTDEDGRTVVFGLRLPVAPTADVTVPVSFSLDGELVALVNPVVLTPSTGTANQPVTLQGLPDDVVDGNRAVTVVVGPAVSADARFNGATGTSFVVTNQDTDIADVVAALETRPLVENGGPVQVALRLSARPTQNVTLTFSGSDTTAATLTETSVMFEPDQWNVPHLITVLPTDDASVDGPQPFVVTFDATTSGDPAWSGLVPTALSLNVQDDEFRQLSMGGGWPSMNADGTRVAFVGEDLMVLDVVTGETTSVTEGCTTPGIWGSPVHAAQSDEVVFLSSCTYLLNGVAGPAGPLQLFIWNPDDGLTHVAGTGEVEPSGGVSISADGRVVAFTALASLVPADTDADNDLYLYDRLSSGFTRVTTTATPPGVQPYSYYHLSEGSFGGNDRFIAFRTESNNIVVGDQNNSADAFLFDRSTSNVTRINTNMQGAVGGSLKSLSLSLDGNHAVMLGSFTIEGDAALAFHVKDLVSGAVVRLATPHPFDDLLRNGGLAINADGSTVAFVTRKAVLTSDTLDNEDVYVWKRSTGMFTRLSVGPLGVQAPNATLAIQGVSAAALAPVVVFSSPFDFLGDGGGLFVVRVP